MPTPMDADLQHVARVRSGDRHAYGELVERHREIVFRVAARIVGESDADDVAQDAFVRAYYRIDQFRAQGTFRAWLLQITRTTALNWLAKRRPQPAPEIERLADDEDEDRDRVPVRALEDKERRERLRGKVGLLTPHHRSVLVLRDVEGLEYAEIAETTGMPLGSVKGRLHRARAELIELLRRNSYDWELPDDA